MDGSDAYVNWFLETSAFLSDRLELWFERDRQLHAIELRHLFDMLHWKLDHTFDLHASWQLIIDAEKSNGKIPPIVEFAQSSDKLIAARTAHEVAAQVAMSASTRIWNQFEFDWIKAIEGLDLPGWVSAHVAEVNAWHLDVTSDLPTDGSQKELLARMKRERLVVEAWRDRMELLESPSYPSAQSDHGMVATEQKTLTSLEQRILTLLEDQASSTEGQKEATDGSGFKDGPFTTNGKCYFRIGTAIAENLIPTEFALVEAIWKAPGHTLSLEDAGNAIRGEHNHAGITYKSVAGYRDRINQKLTCLPIRISLNKNPTERVFFEKNKN